MSKKDFPKVVPLKRNSVVEILESMLEMAKEGEIKNFIAAGFLEDGDVVSATVNASIIEQRTLLSYLDSEITIKTMENRYE